MYDMIRVASPLGLLTVVAENEKLIALVIDGQKYAERHFAGEARDKETPILQLAKNWLEQYFDGKKPDVTVLPLAPKGTDFQRKVWNALLEIPYGQTISYGDLAAKLHSSPRAVGTAIGRNPLSILIPCHRVLGSNGSLTGYAGGLENKAKLLKLEGSLT